MVKETTLTVKDLEKLKIATKQDDLRKLPEKVKKQKQAKQILRRATHGYGKAYLKGGRVK